MQRDIKEPCTPALALDPVARRMPMRGVRCGSRVQSAGLQILPLHLQVELQLVLRSIVRPGREEDELDEEFPISPRA